MSSASPLLALPAELRHTIYRYVIQKVRILLDSDTIPSMQTRSGTRIHKPISSRDMLGFVESTNKHKIALLYTSKFCFKDAIEILAQNTQLCLNGTDLDGDSKMLARVDAAFLRRVPVLCTSPPCMLRFRYASFPRLKRIFLSVSSEEAFDIDDAVHRLFCASCGDPSGRDRYQRYWGSVTGGLRTKTQLALSQGWDLRFTLCYGFKRTSLSGKDLLMALKYDLSNDKMISIRLLRNGKTVARGDQLRDLAWEDEEDLSLLFGY